MNAIANFRTGPSVDILKTMVPGGGLYFVGRMVNANQQLIQADYYKWAGVGVGAAMIGLNQFAGIGAGMLVAGAFDVLAGWATRLQSASSAASAAPRLTSGSPTRSNRPASIQRNEIFT